MWDQLGAVCEVTGHTEEAEKAFAKAAALRKESEPPEQQDEATEDKEAPEDEL